MKSEKNERRKEGGIWADESMKRPMDTCSTNAAVELEKEEGT